MRLLPVVGIAVVAGCVYFNAMYDADQAYDEGVRSVQEQSPVLARVHFDSVIAKTGRIVEDHPDSKYADDAAILKIRAELYNELWDSAVESSRLAERLADDPTHRALAIGLRGVALGHLGADAEADSLLTEALAVDVGPEDRAQFLFARGLARQRMNDPALAAGDLEAAAASAALSPEGSLTLAVALRDMGDFDRSADVTARLLATASASPQSPLYLHVDSLAQLAPFVVDSMIARLLQDPRTSATRQAGYHLIAGRAEAREGRDSAALASFDAAMEAAPTSQSAADAAWYASELRLAAADRPQAIDALLRTLQNARRVSRPALQRKAAGWNTAAREFQSLEATYESRGTSVAEALLRAAEVADLELGAPALARGNYLLYLQVDPGSRWAAKAIYGALSVSGYTPDSSWVVDRGPETDAELRRRLTSLPADDPYRLALTRDSIGTMADSMYVLAEADLERRIMEIQVLYDPTAADTAAAEEDEVADPEDEEIQN